MPAYSDMGSVFSVAVCWAAERLVVAKFKRASRSSCPPSTLYHSQAYKRIDQYEQMILQHRVWIALCGPVNGGNFLTYAE